MDESIESRSASVRCLVLVCWVEDVDSVRREEYAGLAVVDDDDDDDTAGAVAIDRYE